jgi:hypothetical protein
MKKPAFTSLAFATPPLFFFLATVIGAVRWFSPVPFWDMWDGTLQFYLNIKTQGLYAFLEQANEHRIILSKILFWLDYRLFGGLSYLLIAVNLLLMAALWAALTYAARVLMGENRRLAWLVSGVAAVLCFSWLQAENINWGYQSAFYMAYLLPLLALMSMAHWIGEPGRTRWFISALVLGALSTVTMANGLLTLALLILMLAISGRCTRVNLVSLIVATLATYALWKYHYVAMPHPTAPVMQMVKFLLTFLGAPFGYLFHYDPLTILIGASVIMASVYLAAKWLRGATCDPFYLALVLFIAYVGAAGAAATISRAYFGLGAALAGRYETPVMLLYASLLLAFAHLNRERASTVAVVKTLLVVVPVVLLASQGDAISSTGPELARNRMQAALALNLGVHDDETISLVYPEETPVRIAQVHNVARNAMQANVSVFGLASLRAARGAIGMRPVDAGLIECHGNVDRAEPIKTDSRHYCVSGWAFDEGKKSVPATVFLVSDGVVVGAALTGINRPDVQQIINPRALRSGFRGYSKGSGHQPLSTYCTQ